MKKIPVWLLALALAAVGAAGTIGYGYQKANDGGINGTVNITTSQAVGLHNITFGDWPELDDTALAVISEDGQSFVIGLQMNNGDLYGHPDPDGDPATPDGQEIIIKLYNLAKTDMVVKLTTDYTYEQTDPEDSIDIWFNAAAEGIVAKITSSTYYISIPATVGQDIGYAEIYMWVEVGPGILPGFYTFNMSLEPTIYGELETANMDP